MWVGKQVYPTYRVLPAETIRSTAHFAAAEFKKSEAFIYLGHLATNKI